MNVPGTHWEQAAGGIRSHPAWQKAQFDEGVCPGAHELQLGPAYPVKQEEHWPDPVGPESQIPRSRLQVQTWSQLAPNHDVEQIVHPGSMYPVPAAQKHSPVPVFVSSQAKAQGGESGQGLHESPQNPGLHNEHSVLLTLPGPGVVAPGLVHGTHGPGPRPDLKSPSSQRPQVGGSPSYPGGHRQDAVEFPPVPTVRAGTGQASHASADSEGE